MDNSTNFTHPYSTTPSDGINLYGPERGFLIAYLTLLILTTLSGNVGNILVIGAVTTDRRLKKSGNLFILNLAIADLCVTGEYLFVCPFIDIYMYLEFSKMQFGITTSIWKV